MDSSVFKSISQLLTTPKRIVITSHVNPDGDAVGSSLGLYWFLSGLGHHVQVIIPNSFPSFLAWLPGCDQIHHHKGKKKESDEWIESADVIFCLDFNALNRLETLEHAIRNAQGIRILIDHHAQPVQEFDHMISIIETSSTSEIIFDFIDAFQMPHLMDQKVAECLFVGIMTDTGSFSYGCNYVNTFTIVARLISLGIDVERIHRLVYDTYTESRMRLLGYSLGEKLKVLDKYHTAYISLTKKELRQFRYQIGDTEGIVNYALSIRGVNLAILLMEREKYIRLSFRSKGQFSVNDLARKHFHGGGHRNAAGGNSYTTMEQTLEMIHDLLPHFLDQLNY
ncbi:MAG: bifunctional oligoribonuclease/PAP phosphatase NrnA [Bacteroidales bacterium]|nr:bifunctional oligoribonuclease/PAP phosphatase NrnA [Lentimicrobiaceae bacterium]MDD5694594.1 bifunctional oligoribonuclease/PAP phosphatase NrnA [Bacteroidales bacterium]